MSDFFGVGKIGPKIEVFRIQLNSYFRVAIFGVKCLRNVRFLRVLWENRRYSPETTSFNPNPGKKCLEVTLLTVVQGRNSKQYLGNDTVVLATTSAFESDMNEKTKPALQDHILVF